MTVRSSRVVLALGRKRGGGQAGSRVVVDGLPCRAQAHALVLQFASMSALQWMYDACFIQ